MRFLTNIFVATILVNHASADQLDGHFSSWENVPSIIDSITDAKYQKQLEELHQLTRIKLGYPQSNDEEHGLYVLQTKQNWQQWWESTGKPVSALKQQDAKLDNSAFEMAWNFLGTKQEPPKPILPVWIPETWTLYLTFSNGDYMRETELWILERKAESARLTMLRKAFDKEGYSVSLSELGDFTPHNADQVLKALCYLHRYAPSASEEAPNNQMNRLYYPHSTLQLRDGTSRILWNTKGYNFTKNRPENGDGESGRSYYFLRSSFPQGERWKKLPNPTSDQMEPYRVFLSFRKPYFCSSAADVIELFGQHGGSLEKQAMLEWAEKQKAATNPKLDWKVLSSDFDAAMKVNMINFTRSEIQETQQHIKKLGDRLQVSDLANAGGFDADRAKEKELERYITEMLALKKAEEEAEIQRHPQPLRDLIRVNEHPDDPDLKHLSAAIQAIRNAPDPTLFQQLVAEMHEGTLAIETLLNYILLNEHNLLDLKPWGEKQKALAVSACIDSIPLVRDEAIEDLIESILRVCGGGKIEIQNENGGRSIEVVKTKNGYTLTLSGASNPLSIKQAQEELRRLYEKSRAPSAR